VISFPLAGSGDASEENTPDNPPRRSTKYLTLAGKNLFDVLVLMERKKDSKRSQKGISHGRD